MKALSTVLGSQMLSDAAGFVQSLDATFGGFREKADRTYELLKRRGTQFVVVSAAEPDALREASFFVDRLSQEQMPLAGLILNRTHPTLCALQADRAGEAADQLEPTATRPDALAAAVLRIHADRALTAKREVRLLSRFTGANPHVAIVGVPSLPFDVSDLEALRAIADQITGERRSDAVSRQAASYLNDSDRAAVLALGGEELRPGHHLGMLLEQGAALTFGHAAPDAELDAVVEGVGAAFQRSPGSAGRSRRLCAGRRRGRTARRGRLGGIELGKPRRCGPRPRHLGQHH